MITNEQPESHQLWPEGYREGERISLPGADLSGASLVGADLRKADLRGVDLRKAILFGVNLSDADLRGAILSDADLSEANLSGTHLSGADLSGADMFDVILSGAILSGAILRKAILSGAILSGACLVGADLSEACLVGVDLRNADLRNADLRGAAGLPIADDAPARLLAVAHAALQPGGLKMDDRPTCETTHSMSGWAITQAGEVGRLLESVAGSHLAGLYLLGPEAALHFYDSDKDATDYLSGVIAAAEEQGGKADD